MRDWEAERERRVTGREGEGMPGNPGQEMRVGGVAGEGGKNGEEGVMDSRGRWETRRGIGTARW